VRCHKGLSCDRTRVMNEHSRPRARGPYDFADPWSPWAAKDPFLLALAETPAYRRLKHVRFLGGIDYLVRAPNGARGNIRHTRYTHGLGVARLALLYADLRHLSHQERRHYGAAALLHDIGHAPLSHSLEPVFHERFGIDHHVMTRRIIRGEIRFGKEVQDILRGARIDLDRLDALISGKDTLPGDDFFDGPINFDTIEGILRSRTYGSFKAAPTPEDVVRAATFRRSIEDMRIVDSFWRYKGEVYRNLINSSTGILADLLCQSLMRRNISKFSERDFLLTELGLFKRIPELRSILTSRRFSREAPKRVKMPDCYVSREFIINADADFFKRDDLHRYGQKRVKKLFSDQGMEATEEPDLFGDRRKNE